MSQIRQASVAFRTMLNEARRDPIWAITQLAFLPIRAIKALIGGIVLLGIVGLFCWSISTGLLFVTHLENNPIANAIVVFGVTAILLAVAFRLLTNPLITHFGGLDGKTHGTARFASTKEIAALSQINSGLLIGRDVKSGKKLRYDGPGHLLTIAPTRTGKGVGTVIPNLLTANRSIICVDPKGENAKISYQTRQKFGAVYVLDPFGITDRPSAAFNPLSMLDSTGPDLAEDASTLADALVFEEPGVSVEPHWNEEAKALIAGIILYVVCHAVAGERTLTNVRSRLTSAPDTFLEMLRQMQQSHSAHGLIARAANRHLSKSDREAAGVLSAAQRHTHFLDSPRMASVLDRNDFSFIDLKDTPASVFLVLPPDRLSTYSRWLRLLIAQSLTDMARDLSTPTTPVLYMLDEFAALGNLAPVERAMGLMAGYGVQLWPILQDIHQLRATYGKRAGTFLSNTALLQVFGVNDHDSARHISDLLGQQTIIFETKNRSLDAEETGISYSAHHTARSLLTPDEVRNLPSHLQLLFLAGQRPVIAQKLSYYADPDLRTLLDVL